MRVLLVEDETRIAGFVEQALREQGFEVDVANDGDTGYSLALSEAYDVLVLDIMLPGRDGLSIVRLLRERRNNVPVILLTARSELSERLEGLNLGADDYVTKPFYVEELVARVQALVRRGAGDKGNLVELGELKVDLLAREVKRGEESIELTAREFGLLEYLLRSPGRVIPRTQLLEHVWGYDFDPGSNVVDVTVRRLRRKLAPGADELIETVRGVGYRLRRTDPSPR